jgi:ADP-ribose pyrophosphatase YjhB (NUDIX family)
MLEGLQRTALIVVPDGMLQRGLMRAVRFRSWLLGGVFTAGSMVVILDDSDRLLMARPTYRTGWGFPGGSLKRAEQPAAAAVRETREEVGIVVEVDRPVAVYVQQGRRHIDHVFVVQLNESPDPAHRWGEIAEARWFAISELPPLQPEAREALEQLLEAERRG